MHKEKITQILNYIADILELQEVKFKPQAYRRAADSLENVDLDEYRGKLEDIPAVGKHIAAKIQELLDTGKLKYYEKLKKESRIDIENLRAIPFLGPKKIKVLYNKLGVKNVKDLEKVIKKKKVRELEGFGEKTEQILLEGIALIKIKPKRYPIKLIEPIAKRIIASLNKIIGVSKVEIAGSYRRKKETIKDLDILVVARDARKVMEKFTSFDSITHILARGPTKAVIRLENGLQVDLRVVKLSEYGAALQYFTGSKEHNIKLRKLAIKKGLILNEYGLFIREGHKKIAGKTEKGVYKKLGLRFIEPEKRMGKNEIEQAKT